MGSDGRRKTWLNSHALSRKDKVVVAMVVRVALEVP